MQITATMVKELRQRTGAGMMECKKALAASDGNMEAAVEQMRIAGLAKADKKAGNTAAEGVVVVRIEDHGSRFAVVEVNSQTDFAAKAEDFSAFAERVAEAVLNDQPTSVESITVDGEPLEEIRRTLVAKIGENIQVRRFVAGTRQGATLAGYSHGGRIGVIVDMDGGNDALARDVAMHIAASRPVCIAEDDVPAELLEKEKAILTAEAAESGKPAEIVEKMVQGRVRKYLADITLVGQPFVKDPDRTVGELLRAAGAMVRQFHRLEVGEGIEKQEENFAEEVMATVRGD